MQPPNHSLAQAYLENARETLEILDKGHSRLWQATHKYYALYFCAYAILIRAGIRSEIHDCTIALIRTDR